MMKLKYVALVACVGAAMCFSGCDSKELNALKDKAVNSKELNALKDKAVELKDKAEKTAGEVANKAQDAAKEAVKNNN